MDQIIEKVGNFGRFQALVYIATSVPVVVAVWAMLFMVYGNYYPEWTCSNHSLPLLPAHTQTGDPRLLPNDTTAMTSSLSQLARCDEWRQCDGGVTFDTESSTAVSEWNLLCDNSWTLSVIITVQMCGVLAGSLVCGTVGDRFGRKVCLYGGLAMIGVPNLIAAFSTSWQMFTALRFFIGSGIGIIFPVAFVYPMEFVGGWWRPVLASVPVWGIGSATFALLAFIFKDLRHIHFATAAFSALFFLPVFWIPESMRWLAVNGRGDEFKRVLERIASMNKKEPVSVALVDKTIRQIVEAQTIASKPSYIDLFKTKKLRNYSIIFGYTWTCLSFVFYTISFGIRSFSGSFYLNIFIFSIVDVPFQILVGPLCNKFGRRFASLSFITIATVSCFGIVVFKFIPGVDSELPSLVLANIAKLSLSPAWGAIHLFSVELFPTVVRNLHVGYLNSLSRFGAILSPFVVPADASTMFIAYAIMGGLLLLVLVLLSTVPESKGMAMEDALEQRAKKTNQTIFVPLETLPEEEKLVDGM